MKEVIEDFKEKEKEKN